MPSYRLVTSCQASPHLRDPELLHAYKISLCRYAKQELGIQFLVGVETEFTLLKSINPIVPVNSCEYSTVLGLTTGTVEARVLEEIADALQADGINVEMYHAEAAPGQVRSSDIVNPFVLNRGLSQYEMITGPLSPLEAADALVHTRETIYNIANKHGLKATLAPKLAWDSCQCSDTFVFPSPTF